MPELVTVVIPTYNRADLIIDALDSVVKQRYRPIECIIVDDGSSDNTEAGVARFTKSIQGPDDSFNLRYIRQENLGGNPARNNGIAHATGSLIAFLDSDDAWHADKLEKQIPLFANPEVAAVYCGVQHMDFESGDVLEPSERSYPSGDLLQQLLVRDVTVQTSAYIVRKSIFEQVGNFDTSLQARQDWDMWIRVASAGKIECVPEPLVDFREHAGLRTASNPLKEINGYRAIRKKYAALLAQTSIACRLKAHSAYLKRMGRVHTKHDSLSTSKGIGYRLGAVMCWPFDFDAWAAFAGMLMPSGLRRRLHRRWNSVFGATSLAIRSH